MVIDQGQQLYLSTGYRIARPDRPTDMERKMMRTWEEGREWQPGQCRICAASILQPAKQPGTDAFTLLANTPVTVCRHCEALVQAHYAVERTEADFGDWQQTCPGLFKKIIMGQLAPHCIDERAFKKVVSWRPDTGHGLVLVGDSGCGKTLSLWALKRDLEGERIRCDIYTAVEIARELSKHARELEAALHLWRTKVLCIDDIGKEPITAAAAALLWELIDRRYGEQVPTIITTRFMGQAFSARFKEPALGSDIRRRIGDACRVVTFSNQNKTRTNQNE